MPLRLAMINSNRKGNRQIMAISAREPSVEFGRGIFLVASSAVVWSFGGAIARSLKVDDGWTVVFWRSLFAAGFLLLFMLLRDGLRGTFVLLSGMGAAGLGVTLCFATASTAFIVALSHTTVANILLMQAGGPLIAALLAWTFFGDRVSVSTWGAIIAVITGIAVMVSGSISGNMSPLGDGLALLIAIAFATATVITRRHAHVRMTPAVFLAMVLSASTAALISPPRLVAPADFGLLFVFGALNLGLGLSLFVTGVRLVPATLAALVGTLEPVLGPLWVWLAHGEVPGMRTLLGGSLVFLALVIYLLIDWFRQMHRTSSSAATKASDACPLDNAAKDC